MSISGGCTPVPTRSAISPFSPSRWNTIDSRSEIIASKSGASPTNCASCTANHAITAPMAANDVPVSSGYEPAGASACRRAGSSTGGAAVVATSRY